MAFLALVASHTVNGVAAIHSELIKNTLFKVGFLYRADIVIKDDVGRKKAAFTGSTGADVARATSARTNNFHLHRLFRKHL